MATVFVLLSNDMKISIHDGESGKGFFLILPTRAIKWRFIWQYSKNAELYPVIKKSYKAIREYIKEHGHFTLMEVNSADGDKIHIRI